MWWASLSRPMAKFMSMRPAVRWALLISLGATVLALIWPGNTPGRPLAMVKMDMATSGGSSLPSGRPNEAVVMRGQPSKPPLPEQLPALILEPAEGDPFAIVPTSPPPQALAAVVAMPQLAPATPTLPSLNYRYLGQLMDPQGERKVYVARGGDNKELLLEKGTRLDEGYVVEAITTEAIGLIYEPLQHRVSIPIPVANGSGL